MHTHLRPDVLRLVCAELPSAEATWIRSLSPDELTTHLDAYSVLRRLRIRLPRELEDEFLRCVLEQMSCHDPGCRRGGRTSAWFQYAAAGRHRPADDHGPGSPMPDPDDGNGSSEPPDLVPAARLPRESSAA